MDIERKISKPCGTREPIGRDLTLLEAKRQVFYGVSEPVLSSVHRAVWQNIKDQVNYG